MKNNFHLFWLTALMMLFGQSLSAHDFEVDGIYYNYLSQEDKTVSVTCEGDYSSYSNEYSGNVVIPESVTYSGTTYSVTSIGEYAFQGCTGLASINIPNSVTSIGFDAFDGCTGLTSIEIPNSVTSIGAQAFYNCRGLTSIEIPNSVTSIGGSAFYHCTGLTSIEIPNSVTSIGGAAFQGCTGLTSIQIPNSVTSIGGSAFRDCTGLTSIQIPNSVTSIGDAAFYLCTGLTRIVVATGNSIYDSRNNCNAIIETSTNKLIAGCKNTIIPNSVTSINDFAFRDCTGLTSIEIPNSVTNIGMSAFYGCTGLTSIEIPNSVTNIGSHAFRDCTGLTSIEIPNSVTNIGSHAFYHCTGLTSIQIPNSVTSIDRFAFYECTGLTSVVVATGNSAYDSRNNCNAIIETATNTLIAGCKNTIIPNSVTSIGEDAFRSCTGLTNIEIPNSVTSIGSSAFNGCTGLTSIVVASENSVYDSRNNCNAIIETATNTLIAGCKNTIIPNSVTSIGEDAFRSCTGLTSIEIPNSVTSIGNCAFEGCTGLTSIVIPNSVTSIGQYAFYDCSGLTSIEIPNSVTSIGEDAFRSCTGLTSIEIPNSVTSIDWGAFYGCTGLTSVTALSSTPVSIRYDTFSNTANATLYVPKGSKAAYEAANYWKEFKEIVEIEVGTEEKYNISIPELALGKVTSDKVQVAAGEVVTFTAEPTTGYYLRELKVQKCTSGEDAQAPSIRLINVSSAETVTMTCNAATGSYTGTYTMPACDITVAQADFVAKTKQTIVAQDVTCSIGDTELSVSATNQTQGGGTLTYTVSEGSDVVNVDVESGALTILKAGMATVTVTAAEMEKYLETAVSVQVTVLNTITAQANDVTLPYDGAAHGIQVNVSAPTTGYTVTYGTEAGHYTLTTSPTQTVVGSLTVYYKVSAAGYTDLEGSAKVTIVKADIAADNYDTPQSTAVTGEGLVYTGAAQTLVSGGTTNEGTTYYRVNGGAWSNETPSATEPGTYVIEWYVAGDANHNDMGSMAEPAGTLTVTILDVKEVAIVQGLATFFNSASAYRIPENAKAWTGTVDYANGCVNMREVTGGIIPAGTAVVLTSDDEKVTLVQSLSEASAIESDLHGTDTYIGGALTGDENIYVLRNGEFVWATSGTLASGKAYLVYDPNLAPNHAAAMRLWLNFEEVTSIASFEASAEKSSTYYNLQGQKVVTPQRGQIYLRKGKKAIEQR